MYENPGITQLSSMKVNGGSDEIMSGLIYLPSRDMTWNGNSSLNADKLTVVLNSLVLLGTTDWKVEPFESKASRRRVRAARPSRCSGRFA